MFVLLLTYVRPLEEVDALMREHMAWLSEHPFVSGGVATCEVIQFRASQTADALDLS
jgi:hypothetical protein